MKKQLIVTAALTVLGTSSSSPPVFASARVSASDACSVPTSTSSTPEETAWRIFVAINCRKPTGQLTWESWPTQACLDNPADCKDLGRFRQSILRQALVPHNPSAPQATLSSQPPPNTPRRTGGCTSMTTSSNASPPPTSCPSPNPASTSLQPFVPTNLSECPIFCEEVTVNPSEEAYASSTGLLTQTGQFNYLQNGTITFPRDAIEVKADWVPASSFATVNNQPAFDCSKPNGQVYLEMIGGTCHALVGLHISSKLYPNWLWATFEPQYPTTNPNRCNPKLYNSCSDPWGSNPATLACDNSAKPTRCKTQATPALTTLFNAAGQALDKSFQNYRLTGTQTQFDQPTASAGGLGSSFVEFNAGVNPQQASCITCHSYAQRTTSPPSPGSTPGGGPPENGNNVGTPTPLPAGYKSLDFSWFLGLGVPTDGGSCVDIDAGPIWNDSDAGNKCPKVCAGVGRTWNHKWTTTQPGKMSVCGCCL